MFVRRVLSVAALVLATVSAQNAAAEEALRDMQIGMQGLAAAAKDPAMLAQLMADLQVGQNFVCYG